MTQQTRLQELLTKRQAIRTPQKKNYDVLIAGSGPIGATYARYILKEHPTATVGMIDIGRKESAETGEHLKNALRFQCDNKTFEHVIKGALQPVSMPANGRSSKRTWFNPDQEKDKNIPGTGVTRVVGGMATHWTCICPRPAEDERIQSPLRNDLDSLLLEAEEILGVHDDQFDDGARQNIIKTKLREEFKKDWKMRNRAVESLPLAAERKGGNQTDTGYVVWSGANTILQGVDTNYPDRFELLVEHQLQAILLSGERAIYGLVQDLKGGDIDIQAKHFVLACGAIENVRILWDSNLHHTHEALGRYLTEQTVAFGQISLRKGYQYSIPDNDIDPQVFIPYSKDFPHHCQIRRDSFPFDSDSTTEDPRFMVDLTFYSKTETRSENRVIFDYWQSYNTDVMGMTQATFEVQRSAEDHRLASKMLDDLKTIAKMLGPDVPESHPHELDFGTALHITGTTRMGSTIENSVVDKDCKVHGYTNLWVGGNGCIPDSTACNPTLTSVAYAINSAKALIRALQKD